MRLADIHARTVTSTIQIFGETVDVTLRPAMFTSEYESAVRSADSPLELATLLARVIVAIDITEPDGDGIERPIVCDGETFHRLLPLGIMMDLWRIIGEVLRPGEAPAET